MRPSRQGRCALRATRFECFEPRLLMSADLVGQANLDNVIECSMDDQLESLLADSAEMRGLSTVRAEYGFTGAGQTVAVIDSGIAYNHVALGGGFGDGYRVVGGFDFTAERDGDPYDDGPRGSHGTHVAGIIGSTDVTNTGVAPGVDLVALRVFDDEGQGKFSWLEEALQWVHDNRLAFENPITTVNISLGANWNSDKLPDWAILEEELAQLESDGIFIAVAAGNKFTTYNTTGLSYPAVSSHVVPVASVDPNGSLSYYSQRDQRVIAAPGRAITSTVPDYRGNGNGIDDDYAKYSGTSMASPYVAGASVLLREAYEFVGVDNATQATLYDLMMSTADTIYDSITGQNYCRLNLDRAIDAIMPGDDYGSTAATAHGLGTLADALSLSGIIGTKTDGDWFQFTAAQAGTVTVTADAADEMVAQWQINGAADNLVIDGESVSFDVVAGHAYTVGLLSSAGIGHYTIDAHLEAEEAKMTDFGVVDQETQTGMRITAAGEWFSMTATTSGTFTVEGFTSPTGGKVSLEIYDANQRLLGRSEAGDSTPRVDVSVSAGDRLLLRAVATAPNQGTLVDFRLTNLVSQLGSTVKILGTSGADSFDFTAGATHRVVLNGVEYAFAASQVSAIQFDGRGGGDTAAIAGNASDETVEIRVGSAEMQGSGYRVTTTAVENVTFEGGAGSDTAVLFDSAGDDTFVATPSSSTLGGQGFVHRVNGFETVRAMAAAGGADTAHFYDSAGNDAFVATLDYAKLYNTGFYLRAEGFRNVYAHATAGGNDVAYLRDSAGDDTFIATPTEAKLFGTGFLFQTEAFEHVYAYATEGGRDTARLDGSAGNDVLTVTAAETKMLGSGFDNRAKCFEQVHAEGNGGGCDTATIYASNATDRVKASGNLARLLGEAIAADLYGFEHVRAQAVSGGRNRIEMAALDYVLELLGDWDA